MPGRGTKIPQTPGVPKKRAEIFVLFLPITSAPSRDTRRCWINTAE